MIIYLHEDIQRCPFKSEQDRKEIDCWAWHYFIWPFPLTGLHICMGVKNRCGQVV